MTLSDGFGDHLSPTEIVQRYERWAHAVANAKVPESEHEDLVQEIRLAVWKAAAKDGFDSTTPGAPKYLAQAATWRMNEIIQRGTWTGRESTRGVRREDLKRDTTSLDTSIGGRPVLDIAEELNACDALAGVELAYHYGEIRQALDALPPQERAYVQMRFWGGRTDPEIKAELGRDLGVLWRMRGGIRDRLRTRLGHLALA